MISLAAQVERASQAFRANEAALRALLVGPTGPVARDLVRRAMRVEAQAKANASGRPGPRVRTGRLRGSITWRLRQDGGQLVADVGTAVEYAPYVELGTRRARAYPFLRPALRAAE